MNTYKVIPLNECKKMSTKQLQKYFDKYTTASSEYSYKLSAMLEEKEEEGEYIGDLYFKKIKNM
jgi:hypothetical protein